MRKSLLITLAISVLCLAVMSGCDKKVVSKVAVETTSTTSATTTQATTAPTTSETTTSTTTQTSKKTTQKPVVQTTTVNAAKLLEQQYIQAYNRTVSQNSGDFIFCGPNYFPMSSYKKMTFSHKNNELIFKYFEKDISKQYDKLVTYNGITCFFSNGDNSFSSGTKAQYIEELGIKSITSISPFISNKKVKNIKVGKQTEHKTPSAVLNPNNPFCVNFETDYSSLCDYADKYFENGDPIIKLTVESYFSNDKKYIQNEVIYADRKNRLNHMEPYTSIAVLIYTGPEFVPNLKDFDPLFS